MNIGNQLNFQIEDKKIEKQKRERIELVKRDIYNKEKRWQTVSKLPCYEKSVKSVEEVGKVKGYGGHSNQGVVRDKNEDRISIHTQHSIALFTVIDGHGGAGVADYLQAHLNNIILENDQDDYTIAIQKGLEEVEESMRKRHLLDPLWRSGACVTLALVKGEKVFVGNVGDCRVVASYQGGSRVEQVTRDHKPNDQQEQKRIESQGGSVYQRRIPTKVVGGRVLNELDLPVEYNQQQQTYYLLGPARLAPGKLSVARTIGDWHLKAFPPTVISAQPDITTLSTQHLDFLVLASDGVYDKLTNQQIVTLVWNNCYKYKYSNCHDLSQIMAELILLDALNANTSDNVTVIFVAFQNFYQQVFQHPDLKTVNKT